ncbi:D-beta-hydroxybutyrate dehydrogenase, mitochondrial-like [Tachypleus tridentatus]|uniref:D-beta-hydroxybutyrate dehydrogenase, mitochondrial-like n=1 Tax=Tachypleus tridentatus TaxID=6853 RepID=UPI003FD0CD86
MWKFDLAALCTGILRGETPILTTTLLAVVALVLYRRWQKSREQLQPSGKSVLVTGCDSGIGYIVARWLDKLGFTVFAGCLFAEGDGAQKLKESCSSRLRIIKLDITDAEQVAKAVVTVKEILSPAEGLYGLVNNAGVLSMGALEWYPEAHWTQVVDVNIKGTIRVTKAFLPLIRKGRGRIITITSIAQGSPLPQFTVYSATKQALEAFSLSLRYEVDKFGVHVCVVRPGNFALVTNVMKPVLRNLDLMEKEISDEVQRAYQKEFDVFRAKLKRTSVRLQAHTDDHTFHNILTSVQHALLSTKPQWCYVGASTIYRLMSSIIGLLPLDIQGQLMARVLKRG